MKTVLCISGLDPCGCAGQLADVKAVHGTGSHALAVPTALTVQNTVSAERVYPVSEEVMEQQLRHLLEDISPAAVKIGMVYSRKQALCIRHALNDHRLPKVVWDPVMRATSGTELMKRDDIKEILEALLPVTHLVTPNMEEAAFIANVLGCTEEMLPKEVFQKGVEGLLVKGGHAQGVPTDFLHTDTGRSAFRGCRVQTTHSRGTGCALSSAIASYWAQEYSLEEAIEKGKTYVRRGLQQGYAIGRGNGPIQHFNGEGKDE